MVERQSDDLRRSALTSFGETHPLKLDFIEQPFMYRVFAMELLKIYDSKYLILNIVVLDQVFNLNTYSTILD